jgi:regulator of replication initiation timing
MDKISAIEDYYFVLYKSVVEIANDLEVSKQYVSKILKNNFPIRYEEEKLRRKRENNQRRRKKKVQKIAERRKSKHSIYDVNLEDLRRQQNVHALMMSTNKTLSTEMAVYSNRNAYNVEGNMLVFNEKLGKKPQDLPEKFSMATKSLNNLKK